MSEHRGASPVDRPVIRMEGVSKRYPGDPPLQVLHAVDLTLSAGEVVAIVGPSGSGKSTLLHLMGTLDRPSSGRIEVGGRDVAALSDRELSALRAQTIGFVFQQFFLLDGMTALENVALGLLYRGVPASVRRTRAGEALERVGLGQRAAHRPNQLSGGERQRVAIARALVGRPAVVLADEPTGNLDSRSSADVFDILRQLNANGTTIAVITHDRELASSFPRQVHLRDGRIVRDVESARSAR